MAYRRRGQDGVHPSGPAKGAEKVDKREGEGPYPKGLPSWPGRGKGSKGEGAGLEREGEKGKRCCHMMCTAHAEAIGRSASDTCLKGYSPFSAIADVGGVPAERPV
jgi:hypothetical protein